MKKDVVLAYCTLCYFQYSLQSAFELEFILFTINTSIIIKKIFLNMIIPAKQKITNHIKWEKLNK